MKMLSNWFWRRIDRVIDRALEKDIPSIKQTIYFVWSLSVLAMMVLGGFFLMGSKINYPMPILEFAYYGVLIVVFTIVYIYFNLLIIAYVEVLSAKLEGNTEKNYIANQIVTSFNEYMKGDGDADSN